MPSPRVPIPSDASLTAAKSTLTRIVAQHVEAHPEIDCLFSRMHLPLPIEKLLPDNRSPWPISAELGRFLYRAVIHFGAERILEFGAGASSLILAHGLASKGGGRLTSIEQMPSWCEQVWTQVKQVGGVDAVMLEAQPRFRLSWNGVGFIFAAVREEIGARGPYDLVFVDAPQAFYGRDGALPLIFSCLRKDAWIVLDDAGRPGEQITLLRWLRSYPGLRLVHFDSSFGMGVALLRFTGDRRRRVDVWSFTASLRSARQLQRFRARMQNTATAGSK
jgi:predicted O-methyltransferase YrrM